MPVYNEEAELRRFFEDLALQEADDGGPLPEGTLHVVLVDSESEDGTSEVVEQARARLSSVQITLVQEPVRHHVVARARGAALVTGPEGLARSSVLASADVDTRFHPRWVADVGRRLGEGRVDAVTYAGSYPVEFWSRVPTLARRYFEEVGTVFFPRATIEEYAFDEGAALVTEQVFHDLVRVPSDAAWALTKDAYLRAGGFVRETGADGGDVMFEGRNLRFRLDALGARVEYANDTPFETSPRRLLHEGERLLGGTAYAGGLTHLRAPVEPSHFEALEQLAERYPFDALRRYVVKHYVLLPVVSRPSLLAGNERYFGEAAEEVAAAAVALPPARAAADVHATADLLLDRRLEDVLDALERL